jgi:predicted secreted protein
VKGCVDISRFLAFAYKKDACTIAASLLTNCPGCKTRVEDKHYQAGNGSKVEGGLPAAPHCFVHTHFVLRTSIISSVIAIVISESLTGLRDFLHGLWFRGFSTQNCPEFISKQKDTHNHKHP